MRWNLRSDEAQDRSLLVLLELPDGEVLEDALLDLLEAVVILVEDLAHRGDVEVVRRGVVPGQIEDPVEVRTDDGVLGGADLHVAQALELLLRDLLGLARELRLRDALLDTVEIALIAVVLAELLLDRLELLAKDVLALVLPHLLLDLGVDALAHLEDLELAREKAEHLTDALLRVDGLEQLRLLFDRSVEVRRHEVGERARRLDRVDERAGLARELRHELDDLLRDVAKAHAQRLGLVVVDAALLETLHLRLEVRRVLRHVLELDAGQALEDERVVARAVLQRLQDAGGATDDMEVIRSRIVRRRILLREDRDDGRGEVVDVFHQRDRLLATNVERRDRAGEQHRIADREDGQLVAELDLLLFLLARGTLLLGHVLDLSIGAVGVSA